MTRIQIVAALLMAFALGVWIGQWAQERVDRYEIAAAAESIRVAGWQRENCRARLKECRGDPDDAVSACDRCFEKMEECSR